MRFPENVPGDTVEIRAEVEAPGFDRDVVRGRMAACFERMRRQ